MMGANRFLRGTLPYSVRRSVMDSLRKKKDDTKEEEAAADDN